MKKFTIAEFKNYLISKDSLGDIFHYLTEENIDKANTVLPFEEVNVGDIAIDYHGEKHKIIDMGTIEEMSIRYRNRTYPFLKEELKEFGMSENDNCIVVKDSNGKSLEGWDLIIYVYGEGGAVVYPQ